MKKWIFFALVAVAVWQTWKHYPELVHRQGRDEAIVQNRSGIPVERVRLTVGGQTFVRENLAYGEDAMFPFQVRKDSEFELEWQSNGNAPHWKGGYASAGPVLQRFTFELAKGGGVVYHVVKKPEPEQAAK